MNTKTKVARVALLGAVSAFFLMAIGCGSSGESDAGANVVPKGPPKGQKSGGKRDASVFLDTK
jgi:hypothetical protein